MSEGLPKIDMSTFLLSISSAAMMSLGVVPPGSGLEPEIDLNMARQNIDLLELMHEKTKGNLTSEEVQLMDSLLFQTRMHYVEVEKKMSQKG
ncbi:MAG: hypothetical protein CL678_11405 [Bdellovibrionaceae bacterium]|nr:hypothetical protein [Pseudobdellovibrionaceae bacterium]|tara:strand:+ start:1311 stop:1586 length:276 start_codon:yes stop_codon:yes gene_type:complete